MLPKPNKNELLSLWRKVKKADLTNCSSMSIEELRTALTTDRYVQALKPVKKCLIKSSINLKKTKNIKGAK